LFLAYFPPASFTPEQRATVNDNIVWAVLGIIGSVVVATGVEDSSGKTADGKVKAAQVNAGVATDGTDGAIIVGGTPSQPTVRRPSTINPLTPVR
jgi:hypothetical protein